MRDPYGSHRGFVETRDVRASVPYGAGVSARKYAVSDRNGMSFGTVADVLSAERRYADRKNARRTTPRKREPSGLADAKARAARERAIIGSVQSQD